MMPGIIEQGNTVFKPGMILMISAFMSVWTLLELMKMLSVSHANSPAQSIDLIFNRLMLYGFLVAVAQTELGSLINNWIVPIYSGIIGLGAQFMNAGGSCGTGGGGAGFAGLASAGQAYMCALGETFGKGIGIGGYIIDTADFRLNSWPFAQLIFGILIVVIYTWQMFKTPLLFIDCLLRLAVVLTFFPVIVLAYLFKPTRGLVKSALSSVLASALTFLITAIIVSIAVRLLDGAFNGLFGNDLTGEILSIFGPIDVLDGLRLVILAMATGSMISLAPKIAAEFTGFTGSMGGTGAGVAGAVAAGAGAGATAIGMGAGKIASSTVQLGKAGVDKVGEMRKGPAAAGDAAMKP